MDRIKVERAIDGLAEWQKHVQTNSDIDMDISTAIEALKAQQKMQLADSRHSMRSVNTHQSGWSTPML